MLYNNKTNRSFMNVRRHQLEPNFTIPQEHVDEWNNADVSSGSDSGNEEMDPQAGKSLTVYVA